MAATDRISDERLDTLAKHHEYWSTAFASVFALNEFHADSAKALRELAALRRPVAQSEEVEAIRSEWQKDIELVAECESGGIPVGIEDGNYAVRALLTALDAVQREMQQLKDANESLELRADVFKVADREIDRLNAEIARLSSPPEERREILQQHEARQKLREKFGSLMHFMTAADGAHDDCTTLLQDAARWRNALAVAQINHAGDLEQRDERIAELIANHEKREDQMEAEITNQDRALTDAATQIAELTAQRDAALEKLSERNHDSHGS